MARELGQLGQGLERPIGDPTWSDIKCPAGVPVAETISGGGCRCRITASSVTAGQDPSSLEQFCLSDDLGANGGGYRACPAWREQRRRELAGEPSLIGLPDLTSAR